MSEPLTATDLDLMNRLVEVPRLLTDAEIEAISASELQRLAEEHETARALGAKAAELQAARRVMRRAARHAMIEAERDRRIQAAAERQAKRKARAAARVAVADKRKERNRLIVERLRNGVASLRAIGSEFNVSGERIRQIGKRAGLRSSYSRGRPGTSFDWTPDRATAVAQRKTEQRGNRPTVRRHPIRDHQSDHSAKAAESKSGLELRSHRGIAGIVERRSAAC
jgi:hypothetical protein